MRVIYAQTVPPSVKGETRGELRARVEQLRLNKDVFGDVHDAAELEACVAYPTWWGEKPPAKGYQRCTPSTPDTTRGVSVYVFPVKTVREQLESYFEHMQSADSGLNFMVMIPASAAGKRRDVLLGAASLRLDALTPKTSISGWFTIMSSTTDRVIGRIKLHVTVQYFEAAQRAARAVAAEKEATKDGGRTGTPSPERPPVTEPHDASSRMQEAQTQKSDAEAPTTDQPNDARKQKPVDDAALPPPTASTVPARDAAMGGADTAVTVPQQHVDVQRQMAASPGFLSKLDDVFRRGMEMRGAMARAAGQTSFANASRAHASHDRMAMAFSVAAHGDPMSATPNLLDPLVFQPHGDDDDATEQLSVSAASSDDEVPDEDQRAEATHDYADRRGMVGVSSMAHQPAAMAAARAAPPATGHVIRDPALFRLTIDSVSVASRDFGACQFSLRISRDVLFEQPPREPLWSACFELPLAAGTAGSFNLPVAAYSTVSKLVLEVYGVSHRRREVALLGIAMIPLGAASFTGVDFRCPRTSDVVAQASLNVERTPMAELQRAEAHRRDGHESLVADPPSNDPAASGSGPLVVAPASGAAPALQAPSRPDHELPRRYRVADAHVAAPADANSAAGVGDSAVYPFSAAAFMPQAQASDIKANGREAGPTQRLDLAVTRTAGIPRLCTPGSTEPSDATRLVIAVDQVLDVAHRPVEEWSCDTDAYVMPGAVHESDELDMHVSLNIDSMRPLRDVAALKLRVFAWTRPVPPPVSGNVVTTEELVEGCVDVGTVEADTRFHLRYGGPPVDGWHHITSMGVSAGQLRLAVVDAGSASV